MPPKIPPCQTVVSWNVSQDGRECRFTNGGRSWFCEFEKYDDCNCVSYTIYTEEKYPIEMECTLIIYRVSPRKLLYEEKDSIMYRYCSLPKKEGWGKDNCIPKVILTEPVELTIVMVYSLPMCLEKQKFRLAEEPKGTFPFRSFLHSEELTDLRIEGNFETSFQVHAIILAAHSEVMRALLKSGMSETETRVLKLPDYSKEVVEQWIHFMYTNEPPTLLFLKEHMKQFYSLVSTYQFAPAIRLCEYTLLQWIWEEDSTLTFLEMYELLFLYGSEEVRLDGVGLWSMGFPESIASKLSTVLISKDLAEDLLKVMKLDNEFSKSRL